MPDKNTNSTLMEIWVDADACPAAVKEILFRAAQKNAIALTLVANQALKIPTSPFISFIQVGSGFDVADNEIVKQMKPGDIVITNDIPLASEVIQKKGLALNPRGQLYTQENITSRLYVRDLMDTMRSSGIQTHGPPPMGPKDRQAFANQFNRLLSAHLSKKNSG